MSNNNKIKPQPTPEDIQACATLGFMTRWKALVRKFRGYTSTYNDELDVIDSLHDYQKRWLKDGLGTPIVKTTYMDTFEGLIDFEVEVSDVKSFTIDDCKLYFEALYALEYEGDE